MDTRIRPFALFSLMVAMASPLMTGCEQAEQVSVASSRPVKTIVVGDVSRGDKRSFPAVVDAIQKADISFRVSGKVKKILVKEGDHVKKDQVLAELDPTDFEITLKDRQASYDTAKANFDRAKALVEKGAISKADHDKIRAQYFTAKANLDAARQELAYTKLKASFDGIIAKRHVEMYEEVVLSKPIFSLEDVSALKLIIDVPESLMIVIDKQHKGERKLYAVFDNIPNKQFPLHFVESTTKADPNTKTFKVTLRMDKPERYNVLPGMTATVFAELLAGETPSVAAVSLPVSAVIANNEKQATVWVVDENTMTVKPRTVTPGLLTGNSMQVSGLKAGERIVVAGAPFLREGMKVSLLDTGEQAEQQQ